MADKSSTNSREVSEKSRKLAKISEEARRLDDDTILSRVSQALNIGNYRRHILICTGPDCCTEEEGKEAWDFLKSRLKELNMDKGKNCVYRSKVGCLRVCHKGPTCLVYPEGSWYHSADEEGLERIIHDHLKDGRVVEELRIASNPLYESPDD